MVKLEIERGGAVVAPAFHAEEERLLIVSKVGLRDVVLRRADGAALPRRAVLFRRDLFPELLQLTGDRDGRVLIEKYRKKTALVEWNDEVSFEDIDLRDDYEKMKAGS